jgi:peroxin-3
LLNNEGFSTLVDTKCANEAFKASPVPEAAPQSFDSMATVVPSSTAERKTKLANLLAVLARQAHVIGNGSHAPNEYLAAMDQNVRELEAFSAVIYSSNFDLELPSASKAAADAEIEQEFGSSSYAAVMVEKETEVSSDLGQSAPILLDNDEGISITGAQKGQESEDTPGESAFERAWGKAVEDGTSPQSEGQVS